MRLSRLFALGVLWIVGVALVVPVLPRPSVAAPSAPVSFEASPPPVQVPVMDDLGGRFQAMVDAAASAWAMPPTAALALPDRALEPHVLAPEPGLTEDAGELMVSANHAGSALSAGSAPEALATEPPVEPPPAPKISATAAVVLDETSLVVLYGKREHERRGPASLTKLATAALAVQLAGLEDEVDSTIDSRLMPGSSLMGILPGETYSLEDLLHGLLLVSGNDAARAIAREVAGSEARFVYWMNEMSRRIGLEDTRFIDPHGLGGDGHYSTAFDMALLARYAMQFEDVARVSGTRIWVASGSREILMHNFVNGFLANYPGAEGLKTGYTKASGPTFIGAASRDGHRLYVVLLNSEDRFGEATALLDWAFESYAWPASPQQP